MLSSEDIKRLSADLKIDRERILREYYELLILDELSKQAWSKYLVFKGDTALRLAYGSPRFSDDLDFSLIGKLIPADFFKFVRETENKFNLQLKDTWNKRDTILAEYGILSEHIPQPFRLKIEISKRKSRSLKYELKLLRSSTAPFEILFYVQSLESILADKVAAVRDREEPRDLFDIWYVCKKLDRSVPKIDRRIDSRKVKQTLNKYLPRQWRDILDEITTEIKKAR